MSVRPRPRPLPPRPTPRPTPQASPPSVTTAAPGSLQPPPTPTLTPTVPSASQPPTRPQAPTLAPASPVAPCCPDVATFEGSKGARSTYFGFDDKTNLVANANSDEYWIPAIDPKSLPNNKETRDGARWVSVGVGRETQVTIEFAGSFTTACLPNCSFEVAPAAIATVVTTSVTANGMAFKIRGAQAGEASLKVVCDGKLRGYFHIWCAQPAVIDVDVASIVTPNSRAVAYVASDLEDYINEVFRQSLISVRLNDAGAITVAPTASSYTNGAAAADIAHFTELDLLARAASNKLVASYRLYYYVATAGHSGGLGIVSGGLGAPGPGWSFFDFDLLASYNTMAHEFGHLINLSHPAHDFDKDEFPAFQLSNMSGNVLADDAWNLMGYQGPVTSRGTNRKPLRYRQWKKANRS